VCPDCLTPLVDDLAATVRCRHCGKDWPASMESCPDCLALLRVDPAEAAKALGDILGAGARVLRPEHLPAFRDGPSCWLGRLAGGGGLVLTGRDDFVEAEVGGSGGSAVPPLTCRDVDGTVLFRLDRYEPVEDALVATGAGGAPLGTYIKAGRGMEVRDETSAPVAALRPVRGGYQLVETGGDVLATCEVVDAERGGWIDDEWSLQVRAAELPLKPLAVVAMVLAAKVMFGQPSPYRAPAERREERVEDRGWPYRL
jgi:hypothetical protein